MRAPIYNETAESPCKGGDGSILWRPLERSRSPNCPSTQSPMTHSSSSAMVERRYFCATRAMKSFAKFVTERVLVDEKNPRTHDQGTDEPGRGFARAKTSRRSAMEPTDWHDIQKHRFAQKVAAALDRLVREGAVRALVSVAPPRTLVDLRKSLDPTVRERVLFEINKDLTKLPVWQIEQHITSAADEV